MIAIGEIGLDYYREITPIKIQKKILREQMILAQDLDKPVIIHNRDSDKDIIEILQDFPNVIGVAHCFSSNIETANAFLNMGYYISFSGNLTFKNSHLPEIAKQVPIEKVLIETDSPFLSPVPFRGKLNEPSRVKYVADKLAEIFDISPEEIAYKTSENADLLFRINSKKS